MRNGIRFLLLTLVCAIVAAGQTFSSGSTGADGALNVTSGTTTVALPASGILNYTTVNIALHATLTFKNNLTNTPVIILATGAVNIGGAISLGGGSPTPGPGGFYGSVGANLPGLGPGAGQPSPANINATWVGPLSLVPISGGSGGASSQAPCGSSYVPGGGGGGAIAIASSASITVSNDGTYLDPVGTIETAGGGGGSCSPAGTAGNGSAGAIRLVANSISISGYLHAAIVRLEAPLGQVTYTGSGTAPVISTINPLIAPTKPPSITILSIGGYAVPSYSGASFNSIDLMLPTQLQDPIPVLVQGTNIPVGSPVTINFNGGGTSTTASLAGSTAQSTATVYISGLNRSAVTFLFVSATYDPALISDLRQSGPDAVSKIDLAAAPGQKTQYRFLRRDGSTVELANVSVELRQALGL